MNGVNAYQRTLLATRTAAYKRSDNTVALMLDSLELAWADVATILSFEKVNSAVTNRLMTGKLEQIESVMLDLGDEFNELVNGAGTATIDDVVGARRRATAALAAANSRVIDTSFSRVPVAALRVFNRRVDEEGLKISGGIWAREQMSLIEKRVGGAIARGQSASSLARDLEQFLIGGGAKDTKVRLQGGPPVSYKAARIARSEINNAYWDTQVLSSHESAVVNAQLWQLSGSHPRTDECDLFAWADSYRLGAGTYPTGTTPTKPHPQCLCYLVDVIRDPSEWDSPKTTPQRQQTVISRQALPRRLQGHVGETFTAGELEDLVRVLVPSARGHLTPRYVERMGEQLSTGTAAAFEAAQALAG